MATPIIIFLIVDDRVQPVKIAYYIFVTESAIAVTV